MFHFRRRRKASVSKAQPQTTDPVPWDRYLDIPTAEQSDDDKQERQTDEALLSPSIDSISLPPTPRTPEPLPAAKPETSFRTNGEYYDQLLINNYPQLSHRSPEPRGQYADYHAATQPRRPPTLKNMGTLRGMPLPKRTPITGTAPSIDPRSPLRSPPPTPSSQLAQMALVPTTLPKRKPLKPKSLNLKSSAFQTKAKSIYKRLPTSASLFSDPKPSPAESIASKVSTTRPGASPLVSAASAPAPSSKWRGEFKDLIPRLTVPQSAVPWRNKRTAPFARDRKKFTSDLDTMPDDLLGANHISPPMMSSMFVDDPIPAAFLSAGTNKSNHGLSARSVVSNASISSAVTDRVVSTKLVVKKNTKFELPVTSGKAILFG